MREYQGFPISNFRVGFDEALEPWLLPRDAFPVLQNAHLYRGVIEKIPGYAHYATMSYRQIISMTGTIDGANKVFTATLSPLPTTSTITIQAAINSGFTAIESFMDDGTGVLVGTNTGTGTVNYSTGAVSVTFGLAAPVNKTIGGVQYNAVILTYDGAATSVRPIMGIKQYFNLNGSQDILVFDTRRVGKIVALSTAMGVIQQSDYGIQELPHEEQTLAVIVTPAFDAITQIFTGTVTGPLVPGMVEFNLFANATTTTASSGAIVDNGDGLLTGALLDPTGNNFINYFTGQFIVKFAAPPAAVAQLGFSACVYGDYFTGTLQNFFDVDNYLGYAFITNGIDPPRYYDGSCVLFLNTNQTLKPNTVAPYDIRVCLHLVVQRERLILLNVNLNGTLIPNAAYWSTPTSPLDFSTNGGNLPAPTSQSIVAFGIINSDLIVRFKNSERVLRYTGDAFSPFRWDPTNVLWRCDAPYSSINYDSWFSSVGEPAVVGSDGVNVSRADEIIPDFTLNQRVTDQPVLSIDQSSIAQCYGERFDDFKEGWMCYKSYDLDNAPEQPSDSVLAFNYLDNTYAVYTFPFSCLGFGRITVADVWGNDFQEWQEDNTAWSTYSDSQGALIDLAGDQNGIVYELGIGNSITSMDGTVIPCLFELVSKDFNPFTEAGQLARFGYVDFLVSTNDETKLRVQFYKDNELDADFDTFYQETTLTFTPNSQSKTWKRIYVGAVGKEHTMRIYQNADDFTETTQNQIVRIHAIIPYFKPAGRIFQ